MGTTTYNEFNVGLAIAKSFGKHFSIGTHVSYMRMSIAGYGSTGTIVADVGILGQPFDALWLGAHVNNVTYSKYMSSTYNTSLPVTFNIGAQYLLLQQASLFFQTEISSAQSSKIKMGIEYEPLPSLALRMGASAKPMELFAGAGYIHDNFSIDFAISRHEVLGYSPCISLTYNFINVQHNFKK